MRTRGGACSIASARHHGVSFFSIFLHQSVRDLLFYSNIKLVFSKKLPKGGDLKRKFKNLFCSKQQHRSQKHKDREIFSEASFQPLRRRRDEERQKRKSFLERQSEFRHGLGGDFGLSLVFRREQRVLVGFRNNDEDCKARRKVEEERLSKDVGSRCHGTIVKLMQP